MKHRWKILMIVVVGVTLTALSVAVGLMIVFTNAFSGMCTNKSIAEYLSPTGAMKIVVFQRDCGATTGFSTHASLLLPDQKLPAESAGNLWIADRDHGSSVVGSFEGPALLVRWESASTVILEHGEGDRIFKAESSLEGITARYVISK